MEMAFLSYASFHGVEYVQDDGKYQSNIDSEKSLLFVWDCFQFQRGRGLQPRQSQGRPSPISSPALNTLLACLLGGYRI
jgi:hypothetical protein